MLLRALLLLLWATEAWRHDPLLLLRLLRLLRLLLRRLWLLLLRLRLLVPTAWCFLHCACCRHLLMRYKGVWYLWRASECGR